MRSTAVSKDLYCCRYSQRDWLHKGGAMGHRPRQFQQRYRLCWSGWTWTGTIGYPHGECWHGNLGIRASGRMGENICGAFYQWMRTNCFLSLHTNNLGPGLIAICMIPKLLETACKYSVNPRLVIVASNVHYWMSIEKDVIDGPSILAKLSDKDYCTKECIWSLFTL